MSVITTAIIRRESGQYDPEVVTRLKIERYGILSISNLEQCSALTSLSLAWNEIKTIDGLSCLQNLRRLDLSHNKISRIENLTALSSLEVLNLRANHIESISEIDALVPLPSLTTLLLQNLDGSEENPVCKHPSYCTVVMRVLERLEILDGGHLTMVDCSTKFEEFLETIKPSEEALKDEPPVPWFRPQDLQVDGEVMPLPPSPDRKRDPDSASAPVAPADSTEVRPFHCREHTIEAMNLLETEINKINDIINADSGLLLRKAAVMVGKSKQ